MNTQQALQLAFQHLDNGNLLAAYPLFNSVLQHEPENFAALNGRGFIALQQNHLPQALADLQQSLSVNPKQAFSQKMVGIVLGAMGRFDESMQAFANALSLDSRDPEIYFNRANFRFQGGQVQEALADLDAAIKHRDTYLEARSNRANILIKLGEFSGAEIDLDYLILQDINNVDVWAALGYVKQNLKKYDDSLNCYKHVLSLDSNHIGGMLNSANVYLVLRDFENALLWADKASRVSPKLPEAHYAKGKALFGLGKCEDAIVSYTTALRIRSNYIDALVGRGLAMAAINQFKAALNDYNTVIARMPNYYEAHYNRGQIHLQSGNYKLGWAGYEYRLKVPRLNHKFLPNIPVWHGKPFAGKLLVRGEQGLGDQVLFSSILPELESQCSNLFLQIDQRLVNLFRRSFPKIHISSLEDECDDQVSAQIFLGSLPRFFRNDFSDFSKSRTGYLIPDVKKTNEFRKKISPAGQGIIGLNWRSFKNKYSDFKSINLTDFLPIFELPGWTVVSLQYGEIGIEVSEASKQGLQFNTAVQLDLTNDIDDLASLIDACDIVISVSNSTAHLAGALGKSVLLLLPCTMGKHWYWSNTYGSKSLWYESIDIFGQSVSNNWKVAMEQIVNHLKKLDLHALNRSDYE